MAQQIGFWIMLTGFCLLFYFYVRTRKELKDCRDFINEISQPWPNHVEDALAHILAGAEITDNAVAFHVSKGNSMTAHTESLRRSSVLIRKQYGKLALLAKERFAINIDQSKIMRLAGEKAPRQLKFERRSTISGGIID